MTKIIKNDIVIRLCGDSGDGVQLIGSELAEVSAYIGNDIGTLPDFPSEIRAPRGSLAGVSGYQLNIASHEIYTPGDLADCLVAFNPAALKSNLRFLKPSGVLIVDPLSFSDKNLKMAGFFENPLEDNSLDLFQMIQVSITENTRKALENIDITHKFKDRCKNYYVLGLISYLYTRPIQHYKEKIRKKFKNRVAEANSLVLKAGYTYGENTESFISPITIPSAKLKKGKYRAISGNKALVYGMLAASEKSKLKLIYSGYPITPASEILHELFKHQDFNLNIFQAEDEIAAICSAIGASYAGAIGVTASSGPGISLKTEALSLAVSTELPLLVINVQRSGPSTGMPTKTEQADLNQAIFGRSGEAPIPVLAPSRPSDSFETIYEAIRIAVKYRTPVILLSDSYIGNGAEPWLIPDFSKLKKIEINFAKNASDYHPYKRDKKTLARSFAIPGMKGFEHRIGGLEKENISGNVCYDPNNHQEMTKLRQDKISSIKSEIGDLYCDGNESGTILLLAWGSTYGAVRTAIELLRKETHLKITHIHLRWLNPLHPKLAKLIQQFKQIIIPELNMGQLQHIIRAKYLVDAIGYNRVTGLPISPKELADFVLNSEKYIGKNVND